MSEVKRFKASDMHVACCGDTIVVNAEDYDARDHAAKVYFGSWKRTEQELDAQRLRADTAEAELAALKIKHERTELALSGSMKALTRVDNLWKKRWLEKTGEPAMCLVVDDEFKFFFEEVRDYRLKLSAAEQRIAELSADNQQLRKLLEQTLAALNPSAKLSKSIRAALNPSPEAESHE